MCSVHEQALTIARPRRHDGTQKCLQLTAGQGIFTIKIAGEFPNQPLYLLHQPFGNCKCPASVLPFSVTDEQHVGSYAEKELVGEIISAARH